MNEADGAKGQDRQGTLNGNCASYSAGNRQEFFAASDPVLRHGLYLGHNLRYPRL